MSVDKRIRKHDFRKSLTSDEARELEAIDAETRVLDKRRRELTYKRGLIVNRAIHRVRYVPAGAR
ncbi:MAG TPA: hypothetical protein PK857_00525 [Hyphomicrobium sp.]|nr:hypothetical protein [Hyphomicrobium sp.]HRO48775.1 hypothetical protein [Hyphomicrobium sp.]